MGLSKHRPAPLPIGGAATGDRGSCSAVEEGEAKEEWGRRTGPAATAHVAYPVAWGHGFFTWKLEDIRRENGIRYRAFWMAQVVWSSTGFYRSSLLEIGDLGHCLKIREPFLYIHPSAQPSAPTPSSYLLLHPNPADPAPNLKTRPSLAKPTSNKAEQNAFSPEQPPHTWPHLSVPCRLLRASPGSPSPRPVSVGSSVPARSMVAMVPCCSPRSVATGASSSGSLHQRRAPRWGAVGGAPGTLVAA